MNTISWCRSPREAAQYCKKAFPGEVQSTLELANDLLENRFVFRDHWEMERTNEPVTFLGEIDWTHIPKGDPEWLYALNRHTCLLNLSKAYALSGDERYAAHVRALWLDWIRRTPLTDESEKNTWRSLEAGLRCETWLRAIELLSGSEALDETLKSEMDSCLRIHMQYLLRASHDFHRLSNWGILQDHGLFLLGVRFGEREAIETAKKRLEDETFLQVMRDGSHWEQSPMYHCEVLHCCLDTIDIARRAGETLPAGFLERTHAMSRALGRWCKPNGSLFCQSDSDDIDARDLLVRAATLFSSGELRHYGGEGPFYENIWQSGVAIAGCYKAIAPQPPACPSTMLPDSGNAVLRSDFGENAAYLHIHSGVLGSGHGHADLLHIDVGGFGEDVLIDSGRYTYVDSPIRRQLKLPSAHNTLRVDNTNFSDCIDSWGYSKLAFPQKGEHCFTPMADYFSGAHLGYLSLPGGSVFLRREVVFLKPDIFVVIDSCYGGETERHDYEWSFHFNPKGSFEALPTGARYCGEHVSSNLLLLGGDLAISSAIEPVSFEYNALLNAPCLRVTKSESGFVSLISVLSLAREPHELTAELVAVNKVRAGTVLPSSVAQGVKIGKEDREYTVIICHNEAISEVDLLSANGFSGYGKVLVFSKDKGESSCLSW